MRGQQELLIGRCQVYSGAEERAAPVKKTVICRFAINRGDITYASTGQVPGHLLNQFSLDEYREYLRVATTLDGWTPRGSYQ